MSFFTALAEEFTTDNLFSMFLPLAGAIYGDVTSAAANIEAARISANATQQAAAQIAEGNRRAQDRFEQIQAVSRPAQSYLRTVLAQPPDQLTADQKRTLDEVNRQTTNTLATTGLRGAGRAQVAAIKDVTGATRDRMIDENRRRRDDAARILSGQFVDATTQAARLDQDTGKATGEAILRTGETIGDVETTNVANRGKTIGDVTALIASEMKERGRESRFADRVRRRTEGEEEERV